VAEPRTHSPTLGCHPPGAISTLVAKVFTGSQHLGSPELAAASTIRNVLEITGLARLQDTHRRVRFHAERDHHHTP
jgi:hypothetical protein